jgi:hypothetical protein
MTDNTPQYQGVIVFNANDVAIGFGVAAKGTRLVGWFCSSSRPLILDTQRRAQAGPDRAMRVSSGRRGRVPREFAQIVLFCQFFNRVPRAERGDQLVLSISSDQRIQCNI